jgi:hypothetical protein
LELWLARKRTKSAFVPTTTPRSAGVLHPGANPGEPLQSIRPTRRPHRGALTARGSRG